MNTQDYHTLQICRNGHLKQSRRCSKMFQAGSHQDVGHLSFVAISGQAVPPFMALSGALLAMLNDNSSASQPGRAKLGSVAMSR